MDSPLDILRNGFPGPKLSGVCFVLAPVLLIPAAFLLFPFEQGTLEERQAALAQQPLRAAAGMELFLAGWMLAAIAAIALARLIAHTRPRIGALGGCLALAGIFVSMFFGGVATYELAMSAVPDRATVAAIEEGAEPPVLILLSGAGIVFGWLVLAFGAYRSRLLGVVPSVALAATALVPAAVLGGYPVLMPVPFLGMAIALIPLGLSLLRSTDGRSRLAPT